MLTDIQKKVKGKYSGVGIGRGMRKVFHRLLSKPARSKEFWAKVITKYFGVSWKQTDVDSLLLLNHKNVAITVRIYIFILLKEKNLHQKYYITESRSVNSVKISYKQ